MMEAYTTLSALATQTSRVRLGTLVTGVTYRNPALLAKQVTTLDVRSIPNVRLLCAQDYSNPVDLLRLRP